MAAGEKEDARVLPLLRTKGLSIRSLDEGPRAAIRGYLLKTHVEQGVSLSDIARLIGNKTSGYTSWLCRELGVPARPFEEARLKAMREKRRKYERRPFDGTDEDKAYLMGLKRGDLTASKPWRGVVKVTTSTTHPAMARLFHELFGRHGHVYQMPRYKKDMNSYEWNLAVILDDTFSFLLWDSGEALAWVGSTDATVCSFMAGLLDSDGSIVITKTNNGKVTTFMDYYGCDLPLLSWVQSELTRLGHRSSLRRNKHAGYKTKKFGIVHRSDYWQLSSWGVREVQVLLGKVKPRHQEKVRKAELASTLSKDLDFMNVGGVVKGIRAEIKEDVRAFVQSAEQHYLKTHPIRAE
ncbi:MAG: LAGLIDADG family homing endonuclease [Thaumarchaeota archaeon]|nr:LAGLIDADG family homing endonuclease [Nitrososphaerota archaeon]